MVSGGRYATFDMGGRACLLGPGVFEGISFAVAPVNVANLFETLGQMIQSIVAGTLLVFGRNNFPRERDPFLS